MLYLPADIPCASVMRAAGHAVSEVPLGARVKGARPVLVLNLMPEKAACELQLARMLAPVAGECDLQFIPVKIPGQTYKTTPMSHMEAFYEDVGPDTYHTFPSHSLMIITGAPLEDVPYEDVRYWSAYCGILDWAAGGGVARTLTLCWAAFAALWHFDRVPTHHLAAKRFGVYMQQAVESPVLAGMSQGGVIPVPMSRHIELRAADFAGLSHLRILAGSEECGPTIIADASRRLTHIVGHLEYEPTRLHEEYVRDMAKGRPIQPAVNYYEGAEPDAAHIRYTWGHAAHCFYRNFLIDSQQ